MRSPSIDKLAELTEKLGPFPPVRHVAAECVPNRYVEYKLDRGFALAWDLKSTDEISVAKWALAAGTLFPKHTHEQREFVVVYRGRMLHTMEQSDGTLVNETVGVGGFIVIEPGVAHWAEFPENTWAIAITVPGNCDYPSIEKLEHP